MAESFTYEILADYGSISKNDARSWPIHLRSVSWQGKPAKYDIRPWEAGGEGKMGKGISLSREEIIALRDLLNSLEL